MKKLSLLFLLFFLSTSVIYSYDPGKPVQKILFGSCIDQRNKINFWDTVKSQEPDILLLMGDNVYADFEDAKEKIPAYEKVTGHPVYKEIISKAKLLAIWDDHDYGLNDSGGEYKDKLNSKEIFLNYFGDPADPDRKKREGNYTSYTFGPEGKKIQILLLDTRYFRSELKKSFLSYLGIKRYVPNYEKEATLLGKEQWIWLEKELQKKADLRIIVSSIQFLNDSHDYEKWANFPLEIERFYKLIAKYKTDRLVLLSGDRHFSEISVEKYKLPFPFYDFTASSFNRPANILFGDNNKKRIGSAYTKPNFSMMEINWDAKDPYLELKTQDMQNKTVIYHKIPFKEIQN